MAALTLDSSLTVNSPEIADWGNFFFLAQAEHWVVLPPEVALFRGPLAAWAFGLRHRGEPCGFATAVPYRTFAWLGNLILSPDLRGQGFGAMLFDHVCDRLRRSGTRQIWLTASEQGRPLYQRRGFREVDRIERWLLEVPNRRRRKSAANGDLEACAGPTNRPGAAIAAWCCIIWPRAVNCWPAAGASPCFSTMAP